MPYINIFLLNSCTDQVKSYGPRSLCEDKNGITILEKQIITINNSFKRCKIFIVCEQKYRKIKKITSNYKNIEIIEKKETDELNDLHMIGQVFERINDNLLVINDNLILKQDIFKRFNKTRSQLILSNQSISDMGCIINEDKIIQNISWALPLYWTNISYFKGLEFNLLEQISQLSISKKWFLFEGLNWMIDNGGTLHATIQSASKIERVLDA